MFMQNSSQVWKEFNKNKITHSAAHYLLAIFELVNENGYARLSDVANKLKISKGSLSTSLRALMKKGLVLEDENKHLSLSVKGQEFAVHIERTFSVVENFFEKILGVDTKTAEIDACKIEHLLSSDTTEAMMKMLKVYEDKPAIFEKIKEKQKAFDDCSIDGCRKCKKRNICIIQ
jgi:Mn-dependent DtxR family transcriptional regulator